ncbi:ribose ABC transport system [Klebsiella pneumoniae]|uniref:Ribose ABC transport system n=1 Tax=Klebsiella pneumoniae TaxID=573 RepID=A0A377WBW6_KLEPN|nr:ribose ABC transport system [Klebsiella pneumoniae]
MEALLQLKGIDKAFPGVKALSGAGAECLCRPGDGAGRGKWRRQVHYDEGVDRDLHP